MRQIRLQSVIIMRKIKLESESSKGKIDDDTGGKRLTNPYN